MGEEWCTIESDPGVFTSLCEEIGVKGVQFEEIYGLESEAVAATGSDPAKIFGLVFLFKWKKEAVERPTIQADEHGLFFAQQVIQNACATQAILNILLNQPSEKLDQGVTLTDFKNFSAGLDSAMKGEVLNNSEVIRKAHNSFRHQSSFEIVKDDDEKGGDAFHFVGYVCVDKKVYELDGLQKGPILIGDAPAEGPWYDTALSEIKRRTETYQQKAASGEEAVELRFNLMAIVANKLLEAEKKIELKRYLRQRVNISLVSQGEDVLLEDEVDDDEAPDEVPTFEELSTREMPELKKMVEECNAEISDLNTVVEAEKKIRAQWAKENARRRFDLVPLALCAMRHLARRKELLPAFEKGKATHLKRIEDKKAAENTAKA